MKTPDQHLRLIALPAALAFALVGCEKGGESKDNASESESQAAVESGSSQTRESLADPANDFKTGSSTALAPAELQAGGKVIVALDTRVPHPLVGRESERRGEWKRVGGPNTYRVSGAFRRQGRGVIIYGHEVRRRSGHGSGG